MDTLTQVEKNVIIAALQEVNDSDRATAPTLPGSMFYAERNIEFRDAIIEKVKNL
jgi:hypothetical protein